MCVSLNFLERLPSVGGVEKIGVIIHEMFYDDTTTQKIVNEHFIYFFNCHMDIRKCLVDIMINYLLYPYESVG